MLRFDEMLRGEPIRRADRGAGIPFHRVMRGCARRMALAGLVAGNLLLTPALAGAATQDEKPKSAQDAKPKPAAVAATAPAAGKPKVSPYAIANRRHVEAAAEAPAPSMKRAPGQSPMKAKPARAKRH